MPTKKEDFSLSEMYGEKALNDIVKRYDTTYQDVFEVLSECETLTSGIIYNLSINEKKQALAYADVMSRVIRELKQSV
jgi:hypothetical protein